VYTSLTNWNGPPTQTVWWRRCNSASSTSGGWGNVSWHLKPSQTFTDAQLRASCQAVSPPATTGLSRVWSGLPLASPVANYLPSRTPKEPKCHKKAKQIINHQSHCLFTPLSHRRWGQYRYIKAGTERLQSWGSTSGPELWLLQMPKQ
jgi:hypothetical protein